MRRRPTPGACGGQSLVEFGLILPVVLAVALGFIQILFVVHEDAVLQEVASTAAQHAALAGGETATIDAEVRALCRARGLDPVRATLRLDTAVGRGVAHGVAASYVPSDAPPAAPVDGDVTLTLTYRYPSLFGTWTFTLGAGATDVSRAFPGIAP